MVVGVIGPHGPPVTSTTPKREHVRVMILHPSHLTTIIDVTILKVFHQLARTRHVIARHVKVNRTILWYLKFEIIHAIVRFTGLLY